MHVRLAILAKNESATISKTVASALPFVDSAVLVDTGSTDDTIGEFDRACNGINHVVLLRLWRNDYGAMRTLLLENAIAIEPVPDYVLVLDGDHELTQLTSEQVLSVKHHLETREHDALSVFIDEGGISYSRYAFIRADIDWYYKGRYHEVLVRRDGELTKTGALSAPRIIHHGAGRNNENKEARAKLAIDLLMRDWREKNDPRTAYYLADSYTALGRWDEAMDWYARRIKMAGWAEEKWHARFMLGALMCEHVGILEGVRVLMSAWAERPQRIEPLRAIAEVLTNVANRAAVPPGDMFKVCQALYDSRYAISLEGAGSVCTCASRQGEAVGGQVGPGPSGS